MSSAVILVEGLGKRYQLGAKRSGEGYTALRDVLAEKAKSLVRRNGRNAVGNGQTSESTFWALKDVSFEVQQGEVIGIIGRNGAGKSTLLKILSRITEPTEGRIKIKGRVASLLEVGTGFHPELTGRENIYLNGAILGMHRSEIKAKFDEIVAFAEVEKFLDTPVKRYSSGMYVRLAFSVAAHMEPEILIVDEVLAVGDAEFQKKCLGKMGEVSRVGRTVLFVSHNMSALKSLCTKGILLEAGACVVVDDVSSTISRYLSSTSPNEGVIEWTQRKGPQNAQIRFVRAYLENCRREVSSTVACSKEFYICLQYEVIEPIRNLCIGLIIETEGGIEVCGSNDEEVSHGTTTACGLYETRCYFPADVLNAGTYLIRLGAHSREGMNLLLMDEYLTLREEDQVGHGPNHIRLPGIVRPRLTWEKALHQSQSSST